MSFCIGRRVNGIKELMVFHAPLCLAALAVCVLALHGTGEKDWKKAIRASADACWVLVSSVAAAWQVLWGICLPRWC